MGPRVAWVLWSGLLDSQYQLPYPAVRGALNQLPHPGGTAEWAPGPAQLII